MKLFDLLAKLGILRVGTKKAAWHSGRDMPAEFLMDDVANANRDLTTKQDLKDLKRAVFGGRPAERFCTNCGKPVSPNDKFCTACGVRITPD
jgi:zinc-ribbon domain